MRQICLVQYWFKVKEGVDRSVRGKIAGEPLLAKAVVHVGEHAFDLGPWGFMAVEVK